MHLNTNLALDMIEGRIASRRYRYWTAHLALCHDCRRQMHEWKELTTSLKRSHLKDAPPDEMSRVAGIFPETRSRRLVATLIVDSFNDPAFPGVRGSSDGRQIVLRVDEFDVHVKIWGEPDSRQLLGQLLPRGGMESRVPARLHLLKNGERFKTVALEEMGEFRFNDIPGGSLSLQIDLPNITVIGPLDRSGGPFRRDQEV